VDMVLFNGEHDMFALRANELNSIVDVFMVFEGSCTFTGKRKEPTFNSNDDRLAKFKHKISHILVPCFNNKSAWANEISTRWFMRDAFRDTDLIRKEAKDWAIIMASDVDEIPVADLMGKVFHWQGFKTVIFWQRRIFRVRGPTFYYNCRCALMAHSAQNWKGARVFSGGFFTSDAFKDDFFRGAKRRLSHASQDMEFVPGDDMDFFVGGKDDVDDVEDSVEYARTSNWRYVDLPNHGWHFSFFMPAQEIQSKIKAFSHTEFAKPPFTDLGHILDHQKNCIDPFDRDHPEFKMPLKMEGTPKFKRLPAYLKEATSDGRLPSWWRTGIYE